MKKQIFFLLLILFCQLIAVSQINIKMSFEFALLYQSKNDEIKSLNLYENDHFFHNNTKFKIFLKPTTKHTYIYFLDRKNYSKNLNYPYPNYLDQCNIVNYEYYLPDKKNWYEYVFSESAEILTLIVSNVKQVELEKKLLKYWECDDSHKKNEAKMMLETEIRDILLSNSKFKDKTEKPIITTCGYRGDNYLSPDNKEYANSLAKEIIIEFDNKSRKNYVYSNTFRIHPKK